MMISTFQALSLLPDRDEFVWFYKYSKSREAGVRLKRHRLVMTTEQVVELFESSTLARLVRSPGFGYLVMVGGKYVKADGKKAKKLADDCGLRFKKRK
jgi:hypothetical protein